MASAKKTIERKLPTLLVDSSAPFISTVFAKNTVAKRTEDAKEIAAKKEPESTGVGKYLDDGASREIYREIDDWYADRD